MKSLKTVGLGLMIVIGMASCSKKDSASVSVPFYQQGQLISSDTIGGVVPIKGTLKAGKTYTMDSDVYVNATDTLVIQPGVTINVLNGASFIIRGKFASLGTSSQPITITDPTKHKMSGASGPAYADSVNYTGGWGGIYCDSTCTSLTIKWTHLNFAGAGIDVKPFNAVKAGADYVVYFGNQSNNSASFVMEDSWIYGCPDDIVRAYGGNVYLVRNTVEKFGYKGGDGFNVKGNTQGIMAYNLFVGGATNATKSSSDGHQGRQCMIAMFNNTYVNCGHRSMINPANKIGQKGGCIEIENNSRGLAFNNLIVNCRYGLRVAGGILGAKVYIADTAQNNDNAFILKTAYGYNYYYADDSTMTDQFIPTNIGQPVVTFPTNNGVPNMVSFFNSINLNYFDTVGGKPLGQAYNGLTLVSKNNPYFKSYSLPATSNSWATQASVDNYDFHLISGSQAIGGGTNTAFTIPTVASAGFSIPTVSNFGASIPLVTPGSDIGCYQTTGNQGNQH